MNEPLGAPLTRRFVPEPELLQFLVEHVQLSGSSGANIGTGRMPKGVGLSNLGNGNRLLMATATFRNEPFKTAPSEAGAGS